MYLHEARLVRSGFGEPAPVFPKVVMVKFRAENGTMTDPDNCCPACRLIRFGPGQSGTGITRIPIRTGISLGVGRSRTASNGMELQFTVSGDRPGIEYEIHRKRRHSVWQRKEGIWRKLDSSPGDVDDDHSNDDECLKPVNNRLFAFDGPGYPTVKLPAPDGKRWETSDRFVSSDADATDVVVRATFAEWVVARSAADKPWKIISPGPFTFWHSIVWLTRDLNNNWDLGPCSRIALGPISAAVLESPPMCGTPSARELAAEEEAKRWTRELLQTLRTGRFPIRPPRPVPFEF